MSSDPSTSERSADVLETSRIVGSLCNRIGSPELANSPAARGPRAATPRRRRVRPV